MFQRKKPPTDSDKHRRDVMNTKIDRLLQGDLGGTLPSGQPINSVLIEPEESFPRKHEDVSALIYKDICAATPHPVPVSKAPYGAGIDRLYDSIGRVAKKNNTTFDNVLVILTRQLPNVAERRKEQLEALIRNPLFQYVAVEELAKDLITTPQTLMEVENRIMKEAKEPKTVVTKKQQRTEEERNMEILYLKAKRLLAQGFPMDTVREALELSYGTAERFEFRHKWEQEKQIMEWKGKI